MAYIQKSEIELFLSDHCLIIHQLKILYYDILFLQIEKIDENMKNEDEIEK